MSRGLHSNANKEPFWFPKEPFNQQFISKDIFILKNLFYIYIKKNIAITTSLSGELINNTNTKRQYETYKYKKTHTYIHIHYKVPFVE